ncbi:MAG: hypothetical protein GY850_18065, partial [bacterium]|nr:hypothetical protein [bacterium]
MADRNNHRILIFNDPLNTDFKADYVMGRPDFTSNKPGKPAAAASIPTPTDSTFNTPYGMFVADNGDLYVSDYDFNRVLKFNDPLNTDFKADMVFGQEGSYTGTTANYNGRDAGSLSGPIDVFLDGSGNLYISDHENSRLLVYKHPLDENADFVYGQDGSFSGAALAQTAEGSNKINSALIIGGNIYATDTYNHRMLIYRNSTAGDIFISRTDFNFGTVNINFGKTINFNIMNSGIDSLFVDSIRVKSSGEKWSDEFVILGTDTATLKTAPLDTMNIGLKFTPRLNVSYADSLIIYYRTEGSGSVITKSSSLTGTGELPPVITPPDSTADIVIGQPDFVSNTASTSQTEMISPAHAAIDYTVSPPVLYVSDMSNNRITGFRNYPFISSGAAADFVIGQPDFTSSGSGLSSTKFATPHGIAFGRYGTMWIADYSNNRVLGFIRPSETDGIADYVIGQPDMTSNTLNNGGIGDSTLNAPVTVAVDDQNRLYIVDRDNRRVLIYNDPLNTDFKADYVIGQPDFSTMATSTTDSTLADPQGITLLPNGDVIVGDPTNNRVLKFYDPVNTDTKADQVFGQSGSFTSSSDNNPSLNARSLYVPMNSAVDNYGNVYISDYNNHRVLFYNSPHDTTADYVYGQDGSLTDSVSVLDAEGLKYPRGLVVDLNNNLLISDNANSRILIFKSSGSPVMDLSIAQLNFGNVNSGTYDTLSFEIKNSGMDTLFVDSVFIQSTMQAAGAWFTVLDSIDTLRSSPVDTMTVRTVFSPAATKGYSDSLIIFFRTGSGASVQTNTVFVSGNGIVPFQDGISAFPDSTADIVLGQTNFTANGPSASQTTLNAPFWLALDTSAAQPVLYLSDQGNHRILGYYNYPFFQNGQAADFVIGQDNYTLNSSGCSKTEFNSPRGIAIDKAGNLWVADHGNHRVLVFISPLTTDFTADFVFGQAGSFSTGTINNGGVSANSLYNPFTVSFDNQNRVYICDKANHRILVYDNPLITDQTADYVIGQSNFTSNGPSVTDSTFNIPGNCITTANGDLYVADIDNHRILKFIDPLNTDRKADQVFGQGGSYTSGSANNPGLSRVSLQKPICLGFDDSGNFYVCDNTNHRLLVFEAPVDTSADYVYGQNGSFTANGSAASATQ